MAANCEHSLKSDLRLAASQVCSPSPSVCVNGKVLQQVPSFIQICGAKLVLLR